VEVTRKDGLEVGTGVMAGGDLVAFMTVSTDSASPSAPTEDADKVALDLPSASGVVRLSGLDLSAETRKWMGKTVETRASCFYADLNEFRCVASGFRVDLEQVYPVAARERLERDCDTIAKSSRRGCMVTLRFKYADYSRMESGGYGGRLTVVRAAGNVAYVTK